MKLLKNADFSPLIFTHTHAHTISLPFSLWTIQTLSNAYFFILVPLSLTLPSTLPARNSHLSLSSPLPLSKLVTVSHKKARNGFKRSLLFLCAPFLFPSLRGRPQNSGRLSRGDPDLAIRLFAFPVRDKTLREPVMMSVNEAIDSYKTNPPKRHTHTHTHWEREVLFWGTVCRM